MPQFLPFRGLRYRTTPGPGADGAGPVDLSRVVAPPYDVIDDDLRASLEATDPHNSVQLILPRGSGARDGYETAADLLGAWRAGGVLTVDEAPSFYGYRMTFRGHDGTLRHTSGVLGALALPPAGADPSDAGILPHERTLPKARSDRLSLLRATRANLDPIWGLSLASGLTSRLPLDTAADATAVDGDGVVHELWRLDDPAVLDAVTAAVGSAPVVLADGHHRFETASTYRAERPAADAGAAAIMALVVELADEQLSVAAIHRLVHGAPGDVRARITESFEVRDAGPNGPDAVAALERRMRDAGGLGLVDGDGLALLVPHPDALAALDGLPAPLPDVDASRFDAGIRPALGAAELTYRNDAATCAALVDKGAADAAVLLRAVTVEQIRTAAFGRVRMPEKTTFFEPKPRTGMVFRSLDDT
ncbi:MAG TPA: DUF1015 domain-containing protein [Acidimicrobiia bacterium]|nr:DUF1015 domain-containing protein [Acidimicrobiia bacterium]